MFGGDGLQLGCWRGLDEVFQDGHVEVFCCPSNEALQVDLTDRTNRVDISGGA